MHAPSQSSAPFVSVVMCAYNVRPFIERAVTCILEQTYADFELIISDDGSTDGTREWLKQLESNSKVKLFFQEKNLGYVANKNFAISQASGTYITQNDSDDFSDKSRLEKQVAICTKNQNIKIVASGYYKVDFEGNVYETVQPSIDKVYTSYNPSDEYFFWFPSLLVHRDVYTQIGLFTSYFAGMGDDLYWTVKANEKYEIYCLKEPLYCYRHNPNSITNVLDNDRKLIVNELLRKIIQLRKETGTDPLEREDSAALSQLELSLLKNKMFMAEQYRLWAAKAIDKRDHSLSIKLLKLSFFNNPSNIKWYRTFGYFLRAGFNFK